ncbi:MAG: hypothetical protein ABSF15_01410 [Candidatus Sulfotelmatobacter sp.]
MALLGVTFVAGAGASCLLPAGTAHSPMVGCHSGRPSRPQPADYKCCVSRHHSTLLANIFSPRPAIDAAPADVTEAPVAATEGSLFLPTIPRSAGPPGVFILRI